jgi:hypothetical protein
MSDPGRPAQEDKHVEVYPPPPPEPPEPTFRQYFVGWGVIFLALVALGVLLGVLMRVLR